MMVNEGGVGNSIELNPSNSPTGSATKRRAPYNRNVKSNQGATSELGHKLVGRPVKINNTLLTDSDESELSEGALLDITIHTQHDSLEGNLRNSSASLKYESQPVVVTSKELFSHIVPEVVTTEPTQPVIFHEEAVQIPLSVVNKSSSRLIGNELSPSVVSIEKDNLEKDFNVYGVSVEQQRHQQLLDIHCALALERARYQLSVAARIHEISCKPFNALTVLHNNDGIGSHLSYSGWTPSGNETPNHSSFSTGPQTASPAATVAELTPQRETPIAPESKDSPASLSTASTQEVGKTRRNIQGPRILPAKIVDPNRPKRPLNAYNLWMLKYKERRLKRDPLYKITKAELSEGWKILAPEKRERYERVAKELREDFAKLIQDYDSKRQSDSDRDPHMIDDGVNAAGEAGVAAV